MFHPKAKNQRCIPVGVNVETGTCEKTAIGVDADGALVNPDNGGDGGLG